MTAFCAMRSGLAVALDARRPAIALEHAGDASAVALEELVGVQDLVERNGRPALAFRSVRGRLLDRAHVRPLVVDDDEQLEGGVALGAGDADDPRGLELAEHADVRARVVLAAHAAVVSLGLLAQEAEDVHLPTATVPTRPGRGAPPRASCQAKKPSRPARSSTCLWSGLPTPRPAAPSPRPGRPPSG